MNLITIEEFDKLPKKQPTINLKQGKLYYIQDTGHPLARDHDVYIGRFTESTGEYFDFENVEVLVSKRSANGKAFSFKNSGRFIFMEVVDNKPTTMDIEHKTKNITELEEYIRLKRAEPHDETPTVSFIGKDYRKAKSRFHELQKKHTPQSKSKSKGGRMSHRKTKKIQKNTRKNRK